MGWTIADKTMVNYLGGEHICYYKIMVGHRKVKFVVIGFNVNIYAEQFIWKYNKGTI